MATCDVKLNDNPLGLSEKCKDCSCIEQVPCEYNIYQFSYCKKGHWKGLHTFSQKISWYEVRREEE